MARKCATKAWPGIRKEPQVERREASASIARRALRLTSAGFFGAPCGAPLPSPLVREHFPLVREGMEIPGAPRALREQGRRSFGFFTHRLFEM